MLTPTYRLHTTARKSSTKGPYIYPDGTAHNWTFEYQPNGPAAGVLIATLDGQQTLLELPPEYRAVGAHFNRFGLITTHIDGNVQHIYFDDLTYTWKP
jgi:hypothetical protein